MCSASALDNDLMLAAKYMAMKPIERIPLLYKIQDKKGNTVPFSLNKSQLKIVLNLHSHNIIPKARQEGVTTLFAMLWLDTCLFMGGVMCGIISDTLDNATAIMGKIKYAYRLLPEFMKRLVGITKSNEGEILWDNDSKIRVGVSLRGGTYQRLHISELGAIGAKAPLKADEIVSGALNTVSPEGGMVVIESTGEGMAAGHFYNICMAAATIKGTGKPPKVGEYKLHFLPWWENETNRIAADNDNAVIFEKRELEYFKKLKGMSIILDGEQKNFYAMKWREQQDKIWSQYPSTLDEAFSSPRNGAFFTREMMKLREEGRACILPYDRRYPVYGAWDIGVAGSTVCAAFQLVGRQIHFIDCIVAETDSLEDFIAQLKATGYEWGGMFLPHDGTTSRLNAAGHSIEKMVQAYFPCRTLKRVPNLSMDVAVMRRLLDVSLFDGVKGELLLNGLTMWCKKWSNARGSFIMQAADGVCNHFADAVRYALVAVELYGELMIASSRTTGGGVFSGVSAPAHKNRFHGEQIIIGYGGGGVMYG